MSSILSDCLVLKALRRYENFVIEYESANGKCGKWKMFGGMSADMNQREHMRFPSVKQVTPFDHFFLSSINFFFFFF